MKWSVYCENIDYLWLIPTCKVHELIRP